MRTIERMPNKQLKLFYGINDNFCAKMDSLGNRTKKKKNRKEKKDHKVCEILENLGNFNNYCF